MPAKLAAQQDTNSGIAALLYQELKQERAARAALQEQLWQLNRHTSAATTAGCRASTPPAAAATAVPSTPLGQALVVQRPAAAAGHNGEAPPAVSSAATGCSCDTTSPPVQAHTGTSYHQLPHAGQLQPIPLELLEHHNSQQQACLHHGAAGAPCCSYQSGPSSSRGSSHQRQPLQQQPLQQQQQYQQQKLQQQQQYQHFINEQQLPYDEHHQQQSWQGQVQQQHAFLGQLHVQTTCTQQLQQTAAAPAATAARTAGQHAPHQQQQQQHYDHHNQQQQQAPAAAAAADPAAVLDYCAIPSDLSLEALLSTPRLLSTAAAALNTPVTTLGSSSCWSEADISTPPSQCGSATAAAAAAAAAAALCTDTAAQLLLGAAAVRRSNDELLLAESVRSSSSDSDTEDHNHSCLYNSSRWHNTRRSSSSRHNTKPASEYQYLASIHFVREAGAGNNGRCSSMGRGGAATAASHSRDSLGSSSSSMLSSRSRGASAEQEQQQAPGSSSTSDSVLLEQLLSKTLQHMQPAPQPQAALPPLPPGVSHHCTSLNHGALNERFDRVVDQEFDQQMKFGHAQAANRAVGRGCAAAGPAAAAGSGRSTAAAATTAHPTRQTRCQQECSWPDSWDEEIGTFCDGLLPLRNDSADLAADMQAQVMCSASGAAAAAVHNPAVLPPQFKQQQHWRCQVQQQQQHVTPGMQGPTHAAAHQLAGGSSSSAQQQYGAGAVPGIPSSSMPTGPAGSSSVQCSQCCHLDELLLECEFEREFSAAQLAVVLEERDLLALQQQSLLHIMAEQEMDRQGR